jgi:hypothetical protein
VRLRTPHSRKLIVTKVEQRNKLDRFNPLNAELNPMCYLLALLGAHHFLHVSRMRVNDDGRKRTRYIFLVRSRTKATEFSLV